MGSVADLLKKSGLKANRQSVHPENVAYSLDDVNIPMGDDGAGSGSGADGDSAGTYAEAIARSQDPGSRVRVLPNSVTGAKIANHGRDHGQKPARRITKNGKILDRAGHVLNEKGQSTKKGMTRAEASILAVEIQLMCGTRDEKETDTQVIACNDFIRMGPGRNLRALMRYYKKQNGTTNPDGTIYAAPATTYPTLYEWCWAHQWRHRASVWDAAIERDKDKAVREVLNTGLALLHERVRNLKNLADMLLDEMANRDNLWLTDVKMIGRGRDAEWLVIKRFNSSILEQYRGLLDDIAAEMGQRQKVQKSFNYNFDELTDDQLEALVAGKDPFGVTAQLEVGTWTNELPDGIDPPTLSQITGGANE